MIIKSQGFRMKRQQHRIALQRSVLDVSRKLFLEKGYAKTTISEITKTAGITTGSLYHFFKGKEDILLHLTREVFESAATLSDLALAKDADPWMRFALEIGIQFYFIRKHRRVAELYLAAHQSADIAQMIAVSAQVRNQKLFQSCCPGFTSDDFYAAALAVKGIIHSFIQESLHKGKNFSIDTMFRAVGIALAIYQVPEKEIEKSIQATHALIQKSAITLYGFKIP